MVTGKLSRSSLQFRMAIAFKTVRVAATTGQKVAGLSLPIAGKLNHIFGFYFIGPLAVRMMIDIGIFIGHKIRPVVVRLLHF
jgi:hypothetical protein